MFSLKTHIRIALGLFAALLIIGWGGAILQGAGMLPKDMGAMRVPLMVLMFGLTAALAFSLVPVIVKLVLGGRGGAVAIYAIWALMATGIAVALPVAIQSGLFNSSSTQHPPHLNWVTNF
jgi:hypothetical protein